MAVSETRKAQIIDELTRHGVQPNEAAIAQIIEAMKADQRCSVKSACRKYSESVGTNHTTPSPTATTAHQVASSTQNQILDKAARKLADQWKATIENRAMVYLLGDIEAGAIGLDFEDQLVESFSAFGEAVEVEYQAIAGGSPSPLSLPAAIEPGECA